MPKSVLYLHGFASSPHGRKVEKLTKLLAADIELNAPDLNIPSFRWLDFEAMVARALDAGRATAPYAIVGSSLGALVALEVARRGIVAPMVLIAPAFAVADRWKTLIPDGDPVIVQNYAVDARVPIHRAFFDQVERVRVDEVPPSSRVTVIMGRNDESVPYDCVARCWREWEMSGGLAVGSRFVEIPNGDHGLVEFADIIAREICAAVVSR